MGRMARNGRGSAAVAVEAPVRCAVYTRKSTDEGLDRDFNSLDNQRQSAEAYVASQRHEGWSCLPDRYDDGGFSGGTTDRPALKRLLADVERRVLDTVVVYRLDRLSRSLVDFGRIHEFLEKHDVSLVSVTESINTTSPHGRMMVNVLLSFAQYERELIGERTRHKNHAARRRGKWVGGMRVLGYDPAPEGGKLVVNKNEADQVRAIFELYAERRSLLAVATELNRLGWRRKSWTTKDGNRREGKPWDRANLARLLRDPIYIGQQKLGTETFKGEHPAIVPKNLWKRVQSILDANDRGGGSSPRNRHGALLRGILRCAACDAAMVHAFTERRGRAFRYYRCSQAIKSGAAACPTGSVPAAKIEAFVVEQIKKIGADPVLRAEVFEQAHAQVDAEQRGLRAETKRLTRDAAEARREVQRLVAAVANANGAAADALVAGLAAAQERVATLDRRVREVEERIAELAATRIDPDALGRALAEFEPVWEVLTTPERERVVRMLIEQVRYDGAAGTLTLAFSPTGTVLFAAETA